METCKGSTHTGCEKIAMPLNSILERTIGRNPVKLSISRKQPLMLADRACQENCKA